MKRILFSMLALATSTIALAQDAEVIRESNGQKILRGFITQKQLATDSSFTWYAQNAKGFTPDANAVATYKAQKDSVHLLIFGGTWCGDTQGLLPKFFATTDAAGFPAERVTMIGVDRGKKTIQHLTEAFNVVNVPTFIVLKNGKEIGRVVEYGKYGAPEKEVAEIIARGK